MADTVIANLNIKQGASSSSGISQSMEEAAKAASSAAQKTSTAMKQIAASTTKAKAAVTMFNTEVRSASEASAKFMSSNGIDKMFGIGAKAKSASDSAKVFTSALKEEEQAAKDAYNALQKEAAARTAANRSAWRDSVSKMNASSDAAATTRLNSEMLHAKALQDEARSAKEAEQALIAYYDTLNQKGLPSGISAAKERIDKFSASLKKLGNSLARIALYRAVRVAVKEVTDAVTEGTENFYHYSSAIGSSFAPAMNRLKSETNQMKNQLGAAWGGLLMELLPIFIKIINGVTAVANAITKFFAALRGDETYSKATLNADKWAESNDKASGSVKRLMAQLMKFDELNNITTPGSGGSGGGGGATDYGMLYTEEAVGGFAQSLAVRVKDIFFDWGDLNAEQIASKIVAGLGIICGATIGWAVGGVGGAIIGATIGAGLGAVISTLAFDGDGKLSKHEVGKLVIGAIGGIVGAALGMAVGGPAGALIGFTLGASLGVGLSSIKMFTDDAGNKVDFPTWIQEKEWYKTMKVSVKKGIDWVKDAWSAAQMRTATAIMAVKVSVAKGAQWVSDAWSAAKKTAATVYRTVSQSVKKGASWVSDAWEAAKKGAGTVYRTVSQSIKKGSTWVADAFSVFKGKSATAVSVGVSLFKKGWSSLSSFIGSFSKKISLKIDWKYSGLSSFQESVGKVLFGSAKWPTLKFAAHGGMFNLSQGTMLVAGEVPGQAEMVGNINGRTGVASGAEVTGIRDSVESTSAAECMLLREEVALLRELLNKPTTITPSAALGRVNAQSARLYKAVTG